MSPSTPRVLNQSRQVAAPRPAAPRPGGRRRIGEVLIAEGTITPEQLEQALGQRMTAGGRRKRLGHVIIELGFASESDIARALAHQLRLQYLDTDSLTVDPVAAGRVPSALAERHTVLPLSLKADGTMVLACADPTDVVALDDVKLAAGARSLELMVTPESVIRNAFRRAYGFEQRAGELLDAVDTPASEELSPEELAQVAEDAPIVRLAEGIIRDAISAGASDVHVEPGSNGTPVRYRIDGVLHTVTTVPRSATGPLVSRLKLMAGMDIAERRRPQDGRMRLREAGAEVDMRASTLPSMFGEVMVLRLLHKGDARLLVHDVGLDEAQLTTSLAAIERPQGLVLITGPTGSGKTSTLYAFLTELARDTHNVITLEDPVEYQLDGINQTQINEQIGLTFPRCLRTVLRQDPDIVMVGEVRDPETAELAMQASLTGHLVFSTMHTNDAPGAVVRLRDLGIPSYLISSALTMVIAQRLVRTVCERCAVPSAPTDRQVAQLHLSTRELESARLRAGAGCGDCGQTGYKGRTGLFEVLMVDSRVRELLGSGAGESAIRQAARVVGMRSLREDGLTKAFNGITTLEEVLRVTPTDAVDEGTCPGCAQIVEPDFDHCPWCAADLRPETCSACSRALQFGWQVCPSCGTPTTKAAGSGDLPRILVVDDDPHVCDVLAAMLVGEYEVRSAADGEQALEKVHVEQPDAILLDVGLPGISGHEVTRRLRSRSATMGIPIILVTGSDEVSTELDGLRAGADDHLIKPVDPEVLTARLGALLRRAIA